MFNYCADQSPNHSSYGSVALGLVMLMILSIEFYPHCMLITKGYP